MRGKHWHTDKTWVCDDTSIYGTYPSLTHNRSTEKRTTHNNLTFIQDTVVVAKYVIILQEDKKSFNDSLERKEKEFG